MAGAAAARALEAADREIGPAVLVALGAEPAEAVRQLAEHGGDLRRAVAAHV